MTRASVPSAGIVYLPGCDPEEIRARWQDQRTDDAFAVGAALADECIFILEHKRLPLHLMSIFQRLLPDRDASDLAKGFQKRFDAHTEKLTKGLKRC